jgi:hypothetical protein
MSIITRKPVVSTLDSLTKKSNEIFNIFTKTQSDLEAVNSEIISLTTSKREEAKRILDEVAQLDAIAAKNDNLSKKIQTFINS